MPWVHWCVWRRNRAPVAQQLATMAAWGYSSPIYAPARAIQKTACPFSSVLTRVHGKQSIGRAFASWACLTFGLIYWRKNDLMRMIQSLCCWKRKILFYTLRREFTSVVPDSVVVSLKNPFQVRFELFWNFQSKFLILFFLIFIQILLNLIFLIIYSNFFI